MKIYTDTSVFGGCFDDEFREWSTGLINGFRTGKNILVLSDITLEELSRAPEYVAELLGNIPEKNIITVELDKISTDLADHYIREKAVTRKYYNDALHIAIATVNSVDVLVSWNFKHIVNLNRIRLYNSVNYKHSYPMLEIRTPREVLDED